MNKRILFFLCVTVGMVLTVSLIFWYITGTIPFTKIARFKGTPAQCLLYAINEVNRENTQFISIDPFSKVNRVVGFPQEHKEFNAIDIDPATDIIFTNTSYDGNLYKLDAQTAGTSLVGTLPFTKVSSFAFHPHDGSLWAWVEEEGLAKVNPANATATLVYESEEEVESLAWESTGTYIYASIEETTDLYQYNPASSKFVVHSHNLPKDTQSLNTLPEGLLLGVNNTNENEAFIYVYNPQTKQVEQSTGYTINDFDLEGLSWPQKCGVPRL